MTLVCIGLYVALSIAIGMYFARKKAKTAEVRWVVSGGYGENSHWEDVDDQVIASGVLHTLFWPLIAAFLLLCGALRCVGQVVAAPFRLAARGAK